MGKRADLGGFMDIPLVFCRLCESWASCNPPSGASFSNPLARGPRTVGAPGLAALCWLRPNCSGSKDRPRQPSLFLGAAHAKKTIQPYSLLSLSNLKSFSSKFRAVAILEKPPRPFFFRVLQPFTIRKRWIPLSPLASKSSLVRAALWLVAELSRSKERKRERRDHKVPKYQGRGWLRGGDYRVKRQNKTNRKFHQGQVQLWNLDATESPFLKWK